MTAHGEVLLDPAAKTTWRVISLDTDITAKGLQLTGQPVGDAHLTAQSQGQALRLRCRFTTIRWLSRRQSRLKAVRRSRRKETQRLI